MLAPVLVCLAKSAAEMPAGAAELVRRRVDIIVASGGNTSPYRRWHTDRVIREGDLVIVDQNAVGPGGYFVDFVRCFKVGGKWTQKEKDLYKECHESMYAAIEQMNKTAQQLSQVHALHQLTREL